MPLVVLIALAACHGAVAAADGSRPADPPARCDAAALREHVGDKISQIDARGSVGRRVIRPGMAYTQDHRPGRLNLQVDEAGRLLRAWCG